MPLSERDQEKGIDDQSERVEDNHGKGGTVSDAAGHGCLATDM